MRALRASPRGAPRPRGGPSCAVDDGPGCPHQKTMENELALLEQKLVALIAHTRALRLANEDLRRKLAEAHAHERTLEERMRVAATRLDALLANMPTE